MCFSELWGASWRTSTLHFGENGFVFFVLFRLSRKTSTWLGWVCGGWLGCSFFVGFCFVLFFFWVVGSQFQSCLCRMHRLMSQGSLFVGVWWRLTRTQGATSRNQKTNNSTKTTQNSNHSRKT